MHAEHWPSEVRLFFVTLPERKKTVITAEPHAKIQSDLSSPQHYSLIVSKKLIVDKTDAPRSRCSDAESRQCITS